MKVTKMLRVLAMVGIVALTGWLVSDTAAEAGSLCLEVNGTPCSPNFSTTYCYGFDGYRYLCLCRLGTWRCPTDV